jgi:hypothetical protein
MDQVRAHLAPLPATTGIFLHAERVALPLGGEQLIVSAPLPERFTHALAACAAGQLADGQDSRGTGRLSIPMRIRRPDGKRCRWQTATTDIGSAANVNKIARAQHCDVASSHWLLLMNLHWRLSSWFSIRGC